MCNSHQHQSVYGNFKEGSLGDDAGNLSASDSLPNGVGHVFTGLYKFPRTTLLIDLHLSIMNRDTQATCGETSQQNQLLGICCYVDVAPGKLRLTSIIRDFPVPVIAATHGYAIGGGVALAAACDWVVTTSSTRWLMPEVSLGWAPPWGVDDVYRRMGPRALSFLLTNDPLSGEEALRTGLVDIVDEDPVRRARLICTALAEMRPDAIRDLVHMIRSVEMGRYDSSDALERFHMSFDQCRDRA